VDLFAVDLDLDDEQPAESGKGTTTRVSTPSLSSEPTPSRPSPQLQTKPTVTLSVFCDPSRSFTAPVTATDQPDAPASTGPPEACEHPKFYTIETRKGRCRLCGYNGPKRWDRTHHYIWRCERQDCDFQICNRCNDVNNEDDGGELVRDWLEEHPRKK